MALLNLKNKKIVISAGASGIGWAISKSCVSKGALVYLCDIDVKALSKIRKHPMYNKRIFISEIDASISEIKIRLLYIGCFRILLNALTSMSHK